MLTAPSVFEIGCIDICARLLVKNDLTELCTGDTVTGGSPRKRPFHCISVGLSCDSPNDGWLGYASLTKWSDTQTLSQIEERSAMLLVISFVVFRTSLLLHKRWQHAWNFGCRNYLSSKTKMRWSATWLPLSWSAPLFSHMHTGFILRPISWRRRFFYFQQHSWRLGMQNQPIPTHPDVRLEICGSPLCNSEYESFLLCTEVIKLFFSCSTQLKHKTLLWISKQPNTTAFSDSNSSNPATFPANEW